MPNAMVNQVVRVRCGAITPDPEQPRKTFPEEALKELGRSLASSGLLQPIVVRPAPDSKPKDLRYVLVAGERRWRAACELGWETIPAIVRKDLTDAESAKLQLIENIVRQDLTPLEEARALKKMLDEGYTLKELSDATGMVPGQIPWRVQMLNAREEVLDLLGKGHIKPGMCYDMSKLSTDGQLRVMRAIATQDLNATEVNKLCHRITAEESQTEIFTETKVTEEERRVARTFGEAFTRIAATLTKLQKMEERQPGLMAEALACESALVESQVDEAIRGLGKVKSVLQDVRMGQLAEVS